MGFVSKLLKWTLALALCAAFVAMGTVKLTPRADANMYNTMVSHFNQLHKNNVQPISQTGYPAEVNRVAIGVVEVIFGLLAICPHYTRLSAFAFILLSSLATWNAMQLSDPLMPVLAGIVGASVLLFLLSGDAVAKTTSAHGKKKTN